MNEFVYKLGQSKAEKLQSEFTMVHNETAYQIIRELGPEAFAMYFTLSSLAFGKTTVLIKPENKDLQELVGKCERTVQRWKAKLQEAKIIRVAPCYDLKGLQVANVIIFNAAYPEVPEGWDTFAPNGFVQVSEDQAPMVREEYEKLIAEGVAIMQKKRHRNAQGSTHLAKGKAPDRCVTPAPTDVSPLGATDVSPLGATDVSPLKRSGNSGGSKDFQTRAQRKYVKDSYKTSQYMNKGIEGATVVGQKQRDPRYAAFYELFPDY